MQEIEILWPYIHIELRTPISHMECYVISVTVVAGGLVQPWVAGCYGGFSSTVPCYDGEVVGWVPRGRSVQFLGVDSEGSSQQHATDTRRLLACSFCRTVQRGNDMDRPPELVV